MEREIRLPRWKYSDGVIKITSTRNFVNEMYITRLSTIEKKNGRVTRDSRVTYFFVFVLGVFSTMSSSSAECSTSWIFQSKE